MTPGHVCFLRFILCVSILLLIWSYFVYLLPLSQHISISNLIVDSAEISNLNTTASTSTFTSTSTSIYCLKNEDIRDGNWIVPYNTSIHQYNFDFFGDGIKSLHRNIQKIWKPHKCLLYDFAEFESNILYELKNRNIVFFGDSLLRNIYRSFFLLIMQKLNVTKYGKAVRFFADRYIEYEIKGTEAQSFSIFRNGAVDRFNTSGGGYWSIQLWGNRSNIDLYWANTMDADRDLLQPHQQLKNNKIRYDTIIQFAYVWDMGRYFKGFNAYRNALYLNVSKTCNTIKKKKHNIQYLWFVLHKLYPNRCTQGGRCQKCNDALKQELFRQIMYDVISLINRENECGIAMIDTLSFTNTSFARGDGNDAAHFGDTTSAAQLQTLLNILFARPDGTKMKPVYIKTYSKHIQNENLRILLTYDYDQFYFNKTHSDGIC